MAENEETQVEAKESADLVDMDIDTILSMVNRVAKEFADAGSKVTELASQLPEKDLFNLFFALEFLFKSPEGAKYANKLEDDNNAVYLHAGLIEEMENRTGLKYDSNTNFLAQ